MHAQCATATSAGVPRRKPASRHAAASDRSSGGLSGQWHSRRHPGRPRRTVRQGDGLRRLRRPGRHRWWGHARPNNHLDSNPGQWNNATDSRPGTAIHRSHSNLCGCKYHLRRSCRRATARHDHLARRQHAAPDSRCVGRRLLINGGTRGTAADAEVIAMHASDATGESIPRCEAIVRFTVDLATLDA